MRNTRTLVASALAFMPFASAWAQFDGPAPLAWRWLQPTTTAPAGAPVVLENRVYMAVGNRLFCLDKDSGNLLWRYPQVDPIQGRFLSGVVLAQGILVASANNRTVYGVDPQTGQHKWVYNAPDAVVGAPMSVGSLIVMQISGDRLVAIDATTGVAPADWETPLNVLNGIVGPGSPTPTGVLLPTNRNEIIHLNTGTRKIDWARRFAQIGADAHPVLSGGYIYLNSGSYLTVLNPATGRVVRQVNTGEQLAGSPTVSPAHILVVSREGRALVYDLNLTPLTKKPIELGSAPLGLVPPSVVGTKFAVPTFNGALNLLDPTTGEILWSYLVRPLPQPTAGATNPGRGGPGGFPGGPPGGFPGGFPGGPPGGFPGGGPGGQEVGGGGTQADRPVTVQAAGPAVLAGQTLLLPARDGSLLAFDRDLGVDLTPPRVTLSFPNAGDQVSGQRLEMIFRIEDEATGVNSGTLRIEVDGKPLKYDLTREGYVVIRINPSGENRPLTDGRKDVILSVSDWLGNETRTTYSLTVDNTIQATVRPNRTNTAPSGGGRGGPDGL